MFIRSTQWRGEHAAVENNHINYIDRLALYEDTGFAPEELAAKLKELESYKALGSLEKLQALSQSDEAGLLIKTPCMVGDKAWYISPWGEICEATVTNIELSFYSNPRMWLTVRYNSRKKGQGECSSRVDVMVGYYVFFSREEAERALGLKDDEDDTPYEEYIAEGKGPGETRGEKKNDENASTDKLPRRDNRR